MKNIWLISDTHFNQTNILNFEDDNGKKFRGDLFNSTTEMNELIIQNWNNEVRPGDIVYHLGDVFFGDKDWMHKNWSRLMGSKRLIVGNHDDIKFLAPGGFFKKILMWRIFKEFDVVLSHVPIYLDGHDNHKNKYSYNIHGHIHQHKSPTSKHYNVCVEKTDYKPVHLEDIVSKLKKLN